MPNNSSNGNKLATPISYIILNTIFSASLTLRLPADEVI